MPEPRYRVWCQPHRKKVGVYMSRRNAEIVAASFAGHGEHQVQRRTIFGWWRDV